MDSFQLDVVHLPNRFSPVGAVFSDSVTIKFTAWAKGSLATSKLSSVLNGFYNFPAVYLMSAYLIIYLLLCC